LNALSKSKPVLVIDCDGVVYPTSELDLHSGIIAGFDKTIRDVGITPQQEYRASANAREKNHKGLFNFALFLCAEGGISFDKFTNIMLHNTDYTKITHDKKLKEELKKASKTHKVIIYSNNYSKHIKHVLDRKIGKEWRDMGIDIFSIEDSYKGDKFNPKPSMIGYKIMADKFGVNLKNTYMVDDAPRNLDTARALGMNPVLISENNTFSCLSKFLQTINHPPIFNNNRSR